MSGMSGAQKWRLLSWNVNGLRAVMRKEKFLPFVQEARADILCLQETKAQAEQLEPEAANIDAYTSYFQSAQKKGYSGVATYSRHPAKLMARGMGNPAYDNEGRVLAHAYPQFTLFNVYFPNGKARPERLAYKMAFYRDFLKLLADYRKQGHKNLVICGDVNTAHKEIDLARPKENAKISGFLPQERAWIDELLASGFVDSFRVFESGPGHYTWWDMLTHARERNVGWRIDYFFVSESLKPHLKKAFILADVHGSDHCPVGIELAF